MIINVLKNTLFTKVFFLFTCISSVKLTAHRQRKTVPLFNA